MNRRRLETSAGFTLIEAMISMFFIAFIVGELAMVSGYAARSTSYARRISEANMLAEGVLEKSRNTAYANLNTRFAVEPSTATTDDDDPIMFDLTKDGVLESYSEECVPPATLANLPPNPPPVPAGATICGVTAGGYDIFRAISPTIPSPATPFSASTGAAVDVVVRWAAAEIVAGVPTTVAKDVRVSTIRSKF